MAWPVVGTLVVALDALLHRLLGHATSRDLLVWGFVGWLPWSLLAPLVVVLAERFPYSGSKRLFFFVHGFSAFAVSLLHSLLYYSLRILFAGHTLPLPDTVIQKLPGELTLDVLVYSSTLLGSHVVFHLRAAWAREKERIALEHRIARAELDALRFQLPVSTIDGELQELEQAIETDVAVAHASILRFSTSLRKRLGRASPQPVVATAGAPSPAIAPPLPLPIVFLLILGLAPGVLLTLQTLNVIGVMAQGHPVPWERAWQRISMSWFSWPVTLAMVWLGSHVRRVAVLVVVAAAMPPLWDLAFHTIRTDWRTATAIFSGTSRKVDFLLFLGIALGALAYRWWRDANERASAVAALEAVLVRTQARLLRLQLNPHFLFNALNSIAALLDQNRAGAKRMAGQLRRFVRSVLETSDQYEVPLADELELTATYVDIENVRFAGRLQLSIDVDEAAKEAVVPAFVLQPLVENSVRHGLRPARGGRISIAAMRIGDTLQLEVSDDGPSRPADDLRDGIGLSNTRARLRQMYGEECRVEVGWEEGFRATLRFPFRRR
jgi:two-component sensor histidine kinase